ncbi:phosphatase 2C-like domain-containing protein [Gymnopilus junonius]|uniref:Phosphatase 2C-like domain-containing protein n=1 Tax=Gymnopilus junonius TaxID=109634 RepID=A0A9P5N8X9_GYMJU|nr:phosphatase 2C-like domain-containing protein [Gymnopilus junonius]
MDDRNPGDPPDPCPPGEELDAAIRQAFLALDDFIVHESARIVLGLTKEEYATLQAGGEWDTSKDAERPKLPRAKAYDALSYPYAGSYRSLGVALTGDLRAVHGRRVPAPTSNSSQKYTYEATALTADQNASNASEAALLTAAHPDEPDLLKNSRVVGWGCSRAFGDGSMKWPLPVQHQLREKYFGDRVRKEVKTPPYFTAEPVITRWEGKEGQGKVEKGDFVVFGSDGLWECLENEEVIGLVGWWLEERGVRERVKEEKKKGVGRELMLPPVFKSSRQTFDDDSNNDTDDMDGAPPTPVKLHISRRPSSSSSASTTQKTKIPSDLPVIYPPTFKDSTTQHKLWRAEKKFVCEDENIAAHLVRNALGGADQDLREAITGMDVGRCRRFRDDISVVVVFFD